MWQINSIHILTPCFLMLCRILIWAHSVLKVSFVINKWRFDLKVYWNGAGVLQLRGQRWLMRNIFKGHSLRRRMWGLTRPDRLLLKFVKSVRIVYFELFDRIRPMFDIKREYWDLEPLILHVQGGGDIMNGLIFSKWMDRLHYRM